MNELKRSVWEQLFLRRNVVALLAFLGFFNVYSLRVNLSVAIVAMTKNYTTVQEDGTTIYQRDFDWDSREKGYVLSSFFYGYLLTQIIGGLLGARFGGAKVFGTGVTVTAILTLLTPLAAHFGVNVLIANRIIMGFFEGVTYPGMHAVWSRWAPPKERTRLIAFTHSGSYIGTMVAFPVCGFFAGKFGWPSMFYIFGIVGILWCITWFMYVSDSPEKDSYITEDELNYLEKEIGHIEHKQIVHPWKKILISKPVWAINCAQFCDAWGFYTMLTQLPTFMSDTLQFDIRAAGFLSAVPYLVMAITLPTCGILVDKIRRKEILTTTQIRKLCNSVAFLNQAVFMTAAAFVDSSFLTILFITLAIGFGAFASTAYNVNHLDIAPQHASILMGLSNSCATMAGIISPSVTGYIVRNKSKSEWTYVFCISSIIYLFGAVFYAIFGSGELQPWATTNENEKSKKKAVITEENSVQENVVT